MSNRNDIFMIKASLNDKNPPIEIVLNENKLQSVYKWKVL